MTNTNNRTVLRRPTLRRSGSEEEE